MASWPLPEVLALCESLAKVYGYELLIQHHTMEVWFVRGKRRVIARIWPLLEEEARLPFEVALRCQLARHAPELSGDS